MRDFEDSTLWRLSGFERMRLQTGSSGFARLDGPTVLSSTLLADLRRLDVGGDSDDVLEVFAACMRHREPALLCLQHDGLVWPVTVFPNEGVYHSPRPFDPAAGSLATVTMLTAEPPGVRPPGHWAHERIGRTEHYRPLEPLLWALALEGPRAALLAEIAGTVAYRATRGATEAGLIRGGALGSAVERLRRETVSLRAICQWPGLSVERASRLLNGLYLNSALMATRAHPAARTEPGKPRGLFGWR